MEQTNGVAKITTDTVLFFDMDGTLIDTDLANFLSYKKAIVSITKLDNNLAYNPDKRFNRSNLKNAVPNLTETEYERIIQKKEDRKSTRLNSSHVKISYAVFCLKKKTSHSTTGSSRGGKSTRLTADARPMA